MDECRGLIEHAYAASVDPFLWHSLTERLTCHLGSIGGTFIVLDADQLVPRAIQMVQHLAELETEYASEWWQHDPQVPIACGVTETTTYTDLGCEVAVDEKLRAYRSWEHGWGCFHHITSVALLNQTGRLRAAFSFHYGRDGFRLDAIRALERVMPQVTHALELGFQHEEALSMEFWRGLAASDQSPALLLLDETGKVARFTEAALSLIRQNDGVAIRSDRIVASDPASDSVLQAAVANAICQPTVASALRLARRSMRSPYLLTIFPLPRVRRALAPFEAAALVRLVDPADRARDARIFLAQAFGFTKRETDLAEALMLGHSTETAATLLNISIATARIHLRNLFQKAGCNRQSDLIRLLSRLH